MTHDTCSICLEPLIHHAHGVMEPIGAAMCGHCFHCECFWRWEESKRQQDWRHGVASRGCPCPVCNVPVTEFIKLFIDGDTSEIKKLKKELKFAKCKLAREQTKLEEIRLELLTMKQEAEMKAPPLPGSSTRMLESSRRTLEKDIRELISTAALLLSDPPPPNAKTTRKAERTGPSFRRYDSCPLSSKSSTETGPRTNEAEYPVVPNSISMPPMPLSNRQTRHQRRQTQRKPDVSPGRRPEDPPQSRRGSSPPCRSYNRHRPVPEARRPAGNTTNVNDWRAPDPPRAFWDSSDPAMAITSSTSIGSLSAVMPNSIGLSFDDPPSCQGESAMAVVVGDANPTPTNRRPLINFLGVGVDPPMGLLGGCIYMD